MENFRNLFFLIFCMLAPLLFYSQADAGDTLTRIKGQGRCALRCQ